MSRSKRFISFILLVSVAGTALYFKYVSSEDRPAIDQAPSIRRVIESHANGAVKLKTGECRGVLVAFILKIKKMKR